MKKPALATCTCIAKCLMLMTVPSMKNGLSSKQKHKKTQKLILSERFGDPYRRLEDFYHYSGRLQDKPGELVYLSVKIVG